MEFKEKLVEALMAEGSDAANDKDRNMWCALARFACSTLVVRHNMLGLMQCWCALARFACRTGAVHC